MSDRRRENLVKFQVWNNDPKVLALAAAVRDHARQDGGVAMRRG